MQSASVSSKGDDYKRGAVASDFSAPFSSQTLKFPAPLLF